jgi:hypothetical protein
MTDWLRRLFARLTRDREVARIRRDPFLDDPAAVEDDYRRLRQSPGLTGGGGVVLAGRGCFGAGIPRRRPKHYPAKVEA